MIPPRPLSRAARIAWTAAAVILTAVLLVQAEGKALRSFGNDFTSYLGAARALAAHQNPYAVPSPFPYSYPLTLAWLLVPFLLVPLWLATAVWFAIGVFCFAFMVARSGSAARVRLSAWQTTIVAVCLAVALMQILQNELLNGQVNLVVAALTLAAVHASARGARTRAAALWGLAVGIKLLPLVLVPWFVVRRRWITLAAGSAIAVGVSLVPMVWTGADALSWTADYLRQIASGRLGAGADWIHLNLASTMARQAGLSGTPLWLAAAVAGVLVGAMMLLDRRTRDAAGETQSALVYMLLIVLLSPKSETHHMVFTIPAVAALAVHASSAIRLIGLGLLVVLFNIGYEYGAVRDPFLLIFVLGAGAWCAYDLSRR